MSKKIVVSLSLSVFVAFLLIACSGSETTTSNGNSTSDSANKPATTTSSPSSSKTTASTDDDKIGVPECDEFLTKYEACISGKVPEMARAQYKSTLADWRKRWREQANNAQTKASLAQGCKQARDSVKDALKMFGCEL